VEPVVVLARQPALLLPFLLRRNVKSAWKKAHPPDGVVRSHASAASGSVVGCSSLPSLIYFLSPPPVVDGWWLDIQPPTEDDGK
jgi:hypothetical protein